MPPGSQAGHPGLSPGPQGPPGGPPRYPAQAAGPPGVRPVLIQDQPLLLEDLLEQEKQEQRRQQEQAILQQKQEQGMLTGSQNRPVGNDSCLSFSERCQFHFCPF